MTKDIERAKAIVDAYGARPEAWPEAERDMVLRLMAHADAPLKQALEEAQWLDDALDCHIVAGDMVTGGAMATSADNIITNVPFGARQRPAQMRQIWMAVSLAVAASVCGIVFGLSLGLDEVSQMRRIAVLQEAQFLTSEVDQ